MAERGETGLKPIIGWIAYEFARNPYFTVVLIFIFAPYFTTHVVGDPVAGQALWGYVHAGIGAVIALGSPLMGAAADVGGDRKRWIAALSILSALFCASLWWSVPGSDSAILLTIAAVFVATVGLEFATIFHNSILPSVAPRRLLGTVSGVGFAAGNVGGLLMLSLVILCFVVPEQPLLGLDKAQFEPDRMTGPAAAIWLLLFTIPFLVMVPSVRGQGHSFLRAMSRGARNLANTLKSVSRYREPGIFLIARMLYNDGMLALQHFGGVYAAGIFGWSAMQLGIFGISLILSAAVGGLIGGLLDDKMGSKAIILTGLTGLLGAVLVLVSITDTHVLFGLIALDAPADSADSGLFATAAEVTFLATGAFGGALFGAVFASSRTMMARLSPPSMIAEFFGLYALSGTITAFAAPLTVGLLTDIFASQRAGFAAIAVFLALGLALMLLIRPSRLQQPG